MDYRVTTKIWQLKQLNKSFFTIYQQQIQTHSRIVLAKKEEKHYIHAVGDKKKIINHTIVIQHT
jgi:predicted N-acyltransferase